MASAPGSERGEKILLCTVTALTSTTSVTSADFEALGVQEFRERMTWIFECTQADDTPDWDIDLFYLIDTNALTVASLDAMDDTILYRITPALTGATDPIPRPNKVTFTKTSGTLSGNLYQLIG